MIQKHMKRCCHCPLVINMKHCFVYFISILQTDMLQKSNYTQAEKSACLAIKQLLYA